MSEAEFAASFFTLLLLGGLALSVGALAHADWRPVIADTGLAISAAVAIGATVGSLYFSERAGFEPCELCWYQRLFMYPQAIALGVAALRGSAGVLRFTLPASAIGLAIALYHVQLQVFPDQASFCDVTNPCSGRWVKAFGIVTIPQLAALSFTLLLVLGTTVHLSRRSTS